METNGLTGLDVFDKGQPAEKALAVIRVHDRYEREKRQPGAEHWTYEVEGRRQELLRDLIEEWRIIADCHDVTVPFGDDHLCECWVKWRKCTEERKAAIKKDLRYCAANATPLFADFS